jgi:hypothetical protein
MKGRIIMEGLKVKQELLQECAAYLMYGQNIHPVRVQEMIEKAFKAGRNDMWSQIYDPSYNDEIK